MGRTSISYSYDNNGNLTSSTENGETTSYTWNDENHLISVTHPDSSTETYLYCGEGIRRRKTTSTENLLFIRDGQNILQERDGSSGTTIRHYTHQSDGWGELVGLKQSGDSHFYGFDLNGNTRILSDEAGTLSDSYVYTAFGKEQAASGATANPLGYGGNWGYYRESAERVYIRARHLSVNAGRWYSNDPLGFGGGDWNLYRAMGNNPVISRDPSGKFVEMENIGDINAFLAGEARAIYTCKCGWLDASHLTNIARNNVPDLYKNLRNLPNRQEVKDNSTSQTNSLTVNVRGMTGGNYPPGPYPYGGEPIYGIATFKVANADLYRTPSYVWQRMAEYMAYGALWDVEVQQYKGSYAPRKGHGNFANMSDWSYEDLVSDWLAVLIPFTFGTPSTINSTMRRIIQQCGPVSKASALSVRKAMDSDSRHTFTSGARRQNYVPFPNNPMVGAKLFHKAYSWTKKLCPYVPKPLVLGPPNLHSAVGLDAKNLARQTIVSITDRIAYPDITLDLWSP